MGKGIKSGKVGKATGDMGIVAGSLPGKRDRKELAALALVAEQERAAGGQPDQARWDVLSGGPALRK